MSGLADLLAGRTPLGVYLWHAMYDVDDVRRTVELAGWSFAHLDGWVSEGADEFHAGIQQALGFPDHYGRNLDALADSLSELDHPTVLLWDGWAAWARADERTFHLALEVLGARTDTLAVLLRVAGPDLAAGPMTGVPSLD